MLKLVEKLHQKEAELQLVALLMIELLNSCILNANFNEVLGSGGTSFACEYVIKVHLGEFECPLGCDHN